MSGTSALAPRELLLGAFRAAVDAVGARRLLPAHLPPPTRGRTLVVGAGKAAADMAACVEALWPASAPLSGLVITRHGHGLPADGSLRRIEVVEAGHPLPDEAGQAAAQDLRKRLTQVGPDDLVLALISGGGSSLLTLPAAGLSLADTQAAVRALLHCGAPITDINRVRKHLSHTLGGRLAQACAAPVTALLLSDVVGDDPAVIASGPFAADPSTFADALAVLETWRVVVPAAIRAYLQEGAAGVFADTPKPGDACFDRVDTRIVGNGRSALAGAAAYLRSRGVEAVVLGDHYTGEARTMAAEFAALTRAEASRRHGDRPLVLLSGGEAQVTVRGKGRGGRNAEFLLALALDLQGMAGIHALAADTDGIDGSGDNAGALLAADTLARAAALGLDARARLDDNDAYGFFAALGDLLVTGPTRTNANDFRAILIA
ncbi:MAG: glycerate kinase [Thiobacillaceae bacterium]|nr:glycerate kinase [Thiobacillaceae bacterium]